MTPSWKIPAIRVFEKVKLKLFKVGIQPSKTYDARS